MKKLLFLLLLFAAPSFAQVSVVCSGGQIACVIPGASFNTSTSALTLPGALNLVNLAVKPAVGWNFTGGGLQGYLFSSADGAGISNSTTDSGEHVFVNNGSHSVNFQVNNSANQVQFDTTGFIPTVDNTISNGTSAKRWSTVNTVNVTNASTTLTLTGTGPGAAGGALIVGSRASNVGGLWSSNVTPSTSNYALSAGATSTVLNAASGGSVSLTTNDGSGTGNEVDFLIGVLRPVSADTITIGDSTHTWSQTWTSQLNHSSAIALQINGATKVNFQQTTTTFSTQDIVLSSIPTGTAALTDALCRSSDKRIQADTNAGGCLVSAMRFKENDKDMDMGLDTVLRLRPVTYNYKPEIGRGDGRWMGFIADEALKVDERLGYRDPDGAPLGFNYLTYPAVLTKAIQELAAKVEALEKRP